LNTSDRTYIFQTMPKPSPTPRATRPDGRRVRGDRSRRAILEQAVRIASIDGLEALTFGGVALACDIPKSTLQTLFKDRETLQLQTLEAGAEAFAAGIRARLSNTAQPVERLQELCEAWFDQVSTTTLPGGCLVTAAFAEYRARPGAIKDAVDVHRERWRETLRAAAQAAQDAGALRKDVDVEQFVFEMLAFQGSANVSMSEATTADLARARRSARALLMRVRSENST
jgi:AcrR family transcriptional regulator